MAVKNSTILEAIWLEGSNDFQQRVPQPSKSAISDVQNALFAPGTGRNIWNEFEVGLVNRIGNVIVQDFSWANPLAAFKKENLLPMGSMIEEVAMDMIEANGYDIRDSNVFKTAPLEVYSAFHTINREDRYDLTISRAELAKAFTTEYGLNDFLVKKLGKPGQSDAYDEYRIMIQLIAKAVNEYGVFTVNTPIADSSAPTAEELKNLSVAVRTLAKKLTIVPSGKYNSRGVPTVSNTSDLVLIATPEVTANLDVHVLADAFNVDRADLAGNVVEIDEFPVAGVYAMLVDRSWFVCGDYLREISSFFNPKNLTENYYLHHWGVYSVSPFANAVIFGEAQAKEIETVTVDVTGISAKFVDEDGATITEFDKDGTYLEVEAQGTVTPENAKVEVPNEYNATVTIEDSEGNAIANTSRTYLDRVGKLYVQKGLEAGSVVKVNVVSAYNNPSDNTETERATTEVSITIA